MIIDKITFSDLGNKVLQGVCVVGENIFITAYDDTGRNSVVYILDSDYKCIKEVVLYNNSHVGGICFDDVHKKFWITDKKGFISSYLYESILSGNGIPNERIYVGDKLINHNGNVSVAYISYNNRNIYVGNFSLTGDGILKKYLVDEVGSINLESVQIVKFIDKVQGIAFYDDLIVVSTSYGKNCNSELKIFKYNEQLNNYYDMNFISILMPPMMEQVCFDGDSLITLYESNAKKFRKMISKGSDVIVFDFEKVVGI